MINLVDGPTLEILPGDNVALTANPSFDAASFEIWNSLVHGATIFVLTAHLADTDAVVSFFREKHIHKAFLPTAVFHRLFSDAAAAASLGATLRMINIGGEKLTTTIVKSFLRHAPHTRLTNGYGSAETTVCATLFEVTQEALEFDDSVGRPIPIGRPIPNTLFFLLDDDLRPVNFGHPGEICIAGAALARGYLDSSQVPSAKFSKFQSLSV
jgi:non-ribosomal peptide synthetase component F